jgi:anti-sigma-K factor RskA
MPEELYVAMHDEDQDSLAGEYVLGTLSAQEREQAEALRSFDPGFEAAVRQWERRLGELNVMVEAVEPPAETWQKIKTQLTPALPGEEAELTHESPPLPPAGALDLDELPPSLPPGVALDEDIGPPAIEPWMHAPAEMPPPPPPPPAAPLAAFSAPSPPVPPPTKIERSADVIYLASRVMRWQRVSFGVGALAALLALYIAVWQVAPNLIPAKLRPAAGGVITARSDSPPARAQQDRLVAVLQQGPMAPAFLLTVDTQQRTLFVRRVSATPETGKSYELWLISSRFPAPRSLGIVGNDEFTQRAIPANFDVDTLRAASYAVSLEPVGGSPSGAPTGPVLFTGKAVESLPASAPPPAKPAKT